MSAQSSVYENKAIMAFTCPDDCTDPSQGTCDLSSGICTCENGFTGDNCAGKLKQERRYSDPKARNG